MKRLIYDHRILDKRVSLVVFHILFCLPLSLFSAEKMHEHLVSFENLPGIYIERITDRSDTLIPYLKMEHTLCVGQKNIARQEFLSQSHVWFEMKKELNPYYIAHISEPPAAEPNWRDEEVGISREVEYFYGNKYKHIKYGKKFRISRQDGLCQLESYAEQEKQYIDDGEYQYKVTLRNKKSIPSDGYNSVKIRRSKSPVLTRNQADVERNMLIKEQYGQLANFAMDVFNRRQADDSAFNLFQTEMSMTEKKVDQLCEDVVSNLTKGRICYWKKIHFYPNIMERPIILRKVQQVGQKQVVEEAVRFELHKGFKDDIFEPPSKISK